MGLKVRLASTASHSPPKQWIERTGATGIQSKAVKLTPLLQLRYHNSISDALAELGQAAEVRELFAGFQKYLYMQSA